MTTDSTDQTSAFNVSRTLADFYADQLTQQAAPTKEQIEQALIAMFTEGAKWQDYFYKVEAKVPNAAE